MDLIYTIIVGFILIMATVRLGVWFSNIWKAIKPKKDDWF
jgi:hypothetical protein